MARRSSSGLMRRGSWLGYTAEAAGLASRGLECLRMYVAVGGCQVERTFGREDEPAVAEVGAVEVEVDSSVCLTSANRRCFHCQ